MTDTPRISTEELEVEVETAAAGPQETVAPGASGDHAAPGTTEAPQAPAGPGPGAAEPVADAPYQAAEEVGDRILELTADLQRLQAEYVNYKRRVDRDRELVLQNAKLSVLSTLLPVLDDVDRAREHEELSGGFKAVADSLERIAAGQGLVKFGAAGDEFDPRIHEALMHALSPEVKTTTCDKIVQAGYQFGDRLVRPAKVTVVDPDPDAVVDAAPEGVAAEAAAPENDSRPNDL